MKINKQEIRKVLERVFCSRWDTFELIKEGCWLHSTNRAEREIIKLIEGLWQKEKNKKRRQDVIQESKK